MRKSAQEATERNQQLEKDMQKQKQALDEQKRQIAEGETERKRLEAMKSTADDHMEELDRLRQAAEDHLAELDGLKVDIQQTYVSHCDTIFLCHFVLVCDQDAIRQT